jgi:uncharacterized damage-inducible protein DinB
MAETQLSEPWLRGTLTDVPAVQRAVLHALELAREDLTKWCRDLSDVEMNARPATLSPVAFHIRHISRSIDRLLSYAEGKELGEAQMNALRRELDPGAGRNELFAELAGALEEGASRIRAFRPDQLEEARTVGKNHLPTTVGSLLIHIAEHTQRHVGQAITTAKVVVASRK